MSGIRFSGIGSLAHPFAGIFDGNGYRILNMTIAGDKTSVGVGMFNYIKGATLVNVNLLNASVTGGSVVGLLAGNADVAVNSSNREESVSNLIGNCRVSGTVTALNDSNSGAYAGGLVGFNNGDTDLETGISAYSSIDQCTAEVTVNASSAYAGGLVGGNYGYITDSGAFATVNGTDGVGGFAGGNNGEIYGCHADGEVSGESTVGGFAGDYTGTLTGLEKDIQMRGCFGTAWLQMGGFFPPSEISLLLR